MALILSGDTGVPASGMPTGSVIQTVQGTLTGYVRTTSTSFVDTGLTVTITPTSATSKILVSANCNGTGKETTNTFLKLQLVRGSTAIYSMGDLNAYNNAASDLCIGSTDAVYLDSPATTSPTTYKIQFSNQYGTGGVYVNWYASVNNCTSSITVQEIKV